MATPVGTGRALGVLQSVVTDLDKLEMAGDGSQAGFFGVTAVVQPASASQAALTLTTATASGFGFSTASAFQQFTNQLENIRASLVALGLLKGAA